MAVVEQDRIELDYCARCHGVWFDAGELELLLESIDFKEHDISLDDILIQPEAESKEKKYRCPICGRKMKKAHIGHNPQVLIDACPVGHGLWFDGGEVHQLVGQLAGRAAEGAGAEEKVTAFLSEAFKEDK
jgi:Zn-finger nucleic acid-binding protein